MLGSPLINPFDQDPGVQIVHIPEGHLSIKNDIDTEHSKMFFSETMKPRANKFSMKQYLVIFYINPVNYAPRFRIGQAPAVICSHRRIMGKLKKKKKKNKKKKKHSPPPPRPHHPPRKKKKKKKKSSSLIP